MAELSLNDRQFEAFHHQLVGVGVTQSMGVNALLDAGSPPRARFTDGDDDTTISVSPTFMVLSSRRSQSFPRTPKDR